jgi:hypothetical protein
MSPTIVFPHHLFSPLQSSLQLEASEENGTPPTDASKDTAPLVPLVLRYESEDEGKSQSSILPL